LLGVATTLLAWATAAAAEPRHHFAGPRTLPIAARLDPFLLRKQLYPALKAAGIRRIEVVAGDDSIVQERSPSGMMYLDGLPWPALHGVLLLLPDEYEGAEIDLLVAGTGAPDDPDRMWTVRRDLAGGIVVLKGAPPLPLDGPDPTPAELSARFDIGALEESDAAWSPDERRALAKALELLAPDELALIAGTTFRRAKRQQQGRAALHTPSSLGEPSRISLFDTAFEPADGGVAYVGTPERVVPSSVFVILHEIGHVISKAERRRLLLERQAQVESYSIAARTLDLAARESARDAGLQLEREAEMARASLELEGRFASIRALDGQLEALRTGLASVEQRYAELPFALEGPTPDGRGDPRESFAESFALYHVDPESLRWIAPQTLAWFADAAHLEGTELPALAARRSDAAKPPVRTGSR
jgi:hypothetical protein